MGTLYESNETAWELIARGKVRDVYAYAPNEMLIVTSDRLSAFDVILPTPIPDKGIGAHADLQLLVREDEPHHRQPHRRPRPVRGRRGARAPRGTLRRRAQGAGAAGGGDRARVPHRLRAQGLRAYRSGVRHPAARRSGRGQPPARAAVHAVHQGRDRRARREHLVREDRGPHRQGARGARARRGARALQLRRGLRPGARHHHRRHQVRVRHAGRRAHPHRRGADAGLLALLAGRRLRGGREPAELRQAVRARLPGDAGLGQDRPRPGAARRRGHSAPARSTWRRGAA